MKEITLDKKRCAICLEWFEPAALDFLERCEPCFRDYLYTPKADEPRLFQGTGNPHNKKETKAYVERLERKRRTDQGIDHNYVKRTYV